MATTSNKASKTADESTEVAETSSAAPLVEQPPLTTAEDQSMSASPVQSAVQITLQEFMQKLSQRDNRVELINGFYFTERQRGTIKDYESNFQARFIEFTQLVIED
jgi:TolA-binding protein